MAKMKRLRSPEQIEARIAALKSELAASRARQRERLRAALVKLLDRPEDLAAALAWARARAKERAARTVKMQSEIGVPGDDHDNETA